MCSNHFSSYLPALTGSHLARWSSQSWRWEMLLVPWQSLISANDPKVYFNSNTLIYWYKKFPNYCFMSQKLHRTILVIYYTYTIMFSVAPFFLILSQTLLVTEQANHSCGLFCLWAPWYLHRLAPQHSNNPCTLICKLLSQLGFLRIACPRHRKVPSLRSEPVYYLVTAKPSHQGTLVRTTSWCS